MPELKTYHFKLINSESIIITIHCYGSEERAKSMLMDHILEPENWELLN